MATTDMIRFENVKKIYTGLDAKSKDIVALHNVNLSIKKGEFVFVLGHSGAGKSTFLKLILREEAATEGKVFVNGRDLSSIRQREIPYLRRGLGVVFQDFRLVQHLSAFDNIARPLRVAGVSEQELAKPVTDMLEWVGLADRAEARPATLSGGEQQRVAIARAVIGRPDMLVADEPTGNVDPEMALKLLRLFEALNRLGTTVVVATHDLHLLKKLPDSLIMRLDKGRLSDPTGALRYPPRRPTTVA